MAATLNVFPVVNQYTGIDYDSVAITAVRPDASNRRSIARGLIASSPCNGRMAFYYHGDAGRQPGIYVANDDGTDMRLFEPSEPSDPMSIDPWTVTLSPDGQSVAWHATNMYGLRELRIESPSARFGVSSSVQSDDATTELSRPLFSPDGRWVAYTRSSLDQLNGGVLVLVSTETGTERRIDLPMSMPRAVQISPAFDWSPDSRRVVYAGVVGDMTMEMFCELMVIDVVNLDRDTLTNDSLYKDSPRWLPNGRQVCYVGVTELGSDLFVTEQARAARRLTFDDRMLKFALSISQDGRTALYTEIADNDYESPGLVRTFDLITRKAGPVLEANTALAHWRR